jgi:radical SAM superfamily enzyme YgiQ (UPF0313 family)
MKILLVEPRSNHKGANLGLLYLAGALARSRHEALLLDLNNGPEVDPLARIVELVRGQGVDLVGFSLCDVNFLWSMELIRRIKAQLPVRVVAGGPQVNSLGQSLLSDHPELDAALAGECEESLIGYLDHLAGGTVPETVPGLIYRAEGGVRQIPRGAPAQLDQLPTLDYGLLGIRHVSGYMLITSRGCPYKCFFCARNTGDVWRPRDLELCLDELEHARQEIGIKTFRIVDASFNIQEKRVIQFCRRLRERGLDLPWMVSGIRADRLTDASVAALKEAGCGMLAMGVESIDPQVFAAINKGETIEHIVGAMEMCRRHKLEVGCYMIHGLPGDNYERSIAYARQLQQLRPDYVMYNHAIPFVGTELHRWATKQAHVNPEFSWLTTRDFENVAYWTDDFSVPERLDSFRVIQTITHVINFSSQDQAQREALFEEIRRYDPDHLAEHQAYVQHSLEEGAGRKNEIRHLHQEDVFVHEAGYTGCLDVKTKIMC